MFSLIVGALAATWVDAYRVFGYTDEKSAPVSLRPTSPNTGRPSGSGPRATISGPYPRLASIFRASLGGSLWRAVTVVRV